MELAKIFNTKNKGQIYGVLGNTNFTTNNNNYTIVVEYKFKDTVKDYLNSSKSLNALKMVMLDETYIDKTINDLSPMEIKMISLAKALIENKNYIFLDYFEKGLNQKEKENFKRLFKKITQDYNKTVIIYTNDLTFLWDICTEIIKIDPEENITTYKKEDFFNIPTENTPPIKDFINKIREKNINIEDYKNILDLLKAIYRIKGD